MICQCLADQLFAKAEGKASASLRADEIKLWLVIVCTQARLRQIIDLLATDKSRYFVQPRPIIVNYFTQRYNAKLG